MYPGLNQPPEPVITRWATWLRAAIYHCDNFDSVKLVVGSFDRKSAISIAESHKMFAESRSRFDVAFIKTNFPSLVQTTISLQGRGLELKYGIEAIEKIKANLATLDSKHYSDKMDRIPSRYKGFKILVEIYNVLYINTTSDDKFIKKLTPNEITMFKYCPVSSADVEKTFSVHGNVFTDIRRSLIFDNINSILSSSVILLIPRNN